MPFPNPDTQFKPGNPGGPGRPKSGVLSKILREALADADDAEARAIIRALVHEARLGSIAHIKEVFDRIEGKVSSVEEAAEKGEDFEIEPDDRPVKRNGHARKSRPRG